VLAEGMWNHGATMQAQQSARGLSMPVFVGRELADIQAYLRRRRPARDVVARATNPDAGRRLFADKGYPVPWIGGRRNVRRADLAPRPMAPGIEIAGRLWNHWRKWRRPWRSAAFLPAASGHRDG
jgi:hypothetical protein